MKIHLFFLLGFNVNLIVERMAQNSLIHVQVHMKSMCRHDPAELTGLSLLFVHYLIILYVIVLFRLLIAEMFVFCSVTP